MRAVLFAKALNPLTEFYTAVFALEISQQDEFHATLTHHGFELIIHQVPHHIAAGIDISRPPHRRESGAIRLDFSVSRVAHSRTSAKALGGHIDEAPPVWAESDLLFYLGYDPEGNVFGVSQNA